MAKISEGFDGSHSSGRLCVLIHGWEHTPKNLSDLKTAARETFPDADLMVPSYPASTWSNGDLREIAEKFVEYIDSAWKAHKDGLYSEIILIGHSLGALVARKIFLISHGKFSDFWIGGIKPEPRAWAHHITRIILLAGMNRGWHLVPKNKYTPLHKWLGRLFLLGLATLTFRGRLVRSAHTGAEFVVNLRLDWLDLMRELEIKELPQPLFVQLAGTRDTVVHASDHIDLQLGHSFRYLRIEGTSHHAVIVFDNTEEGRARKSKFVRALHNSAEELQTELTPDAERPDPYVRSVILLLHGIRDFGGWTEQFRKEIAERQQGVRVRIYNYGYLPLLPFLFGFGRRRTLRRFMDRYAEARAAYPNATCSFLGHSNGTYLLVSALRRYVACEFERVAFVGSIVNRRFPWLQQMALRVTALRNYVASCDLIVAIFPSVFEKLRFLPWNRDFGSAGHTGFMQVSDSFQNVMYIPGGHGSGLDAANRPALLSFLLGDEVEITPRTVPIQPKRCRAAYSACVYLWILMLAAVVLPFLPSLPFFGFLSLPWWRYHPLMLALYVVCLIFLLFQF